MRTKTFAVYDVRAIRAAAARGVRWDEAWPQLEDAISHGKISEAAAVKLRAKIASFGFAVGEKTTHTIESLTGAPLEGAVAPVYIDID